ncbi:21756_t:CDS:2, partial [Cetraspora pellucida]
VLHLAAIVLDLRLKIQYFKDLGWSLYLIAQIKNIYASVPRQNTYSTLELPPVNIIKRIYKHWHENEVNYPNLAKFAKDCLPIPATSVPSEEVFSIS